MTKTGTAEKKKRWGGLYPPHQRTSKNNFCSEKKKRPANSTPSAVALLDFKPLIIYIQTIKSSYQPKTIQADEVLSKYSIPHSPLDFIPLIYIQTIK